jgi:hypothetical protein
MDQRTRTSLPCFPFGGRMKLTVNVAWDRNGYVS